MGIERSGVSGYQDPTLLNEEKGLKDDDEDEWERGVIT